MENSTSNTIPYGTFQRFQKVVRMYPYLYLDTWNSISDFSVLVTGFEVEMEHISTVGDNLDTVCRIVLDHLSEDLLYYEKLKRVMPET